MTSCTDPLNLNEKQLFKELKKTVSNGVKETKNILEIRDNVLYVWNAEKLGVLTLNIAATRGKCGEDVPYQTLQLTDPPIFEVSYVSINETATQLALWGNLGVVTVELPKRWGKDTAFSFQGGKEVIICMSHNISDFGPTMEIRKARWHPGSPNDSHLLVLTSENGFGLFECELGSTPKLITTWSLGRLPPVGPSNIPDFASLGDCAVDFDFATPTLKESESFADKNINEISNTIGWNQIEWPILALRGNGEVLMVRGNVLLKNEAPTVLGALTMYPPAGDNYGMDSCSIMCVQTTPPIVVIASCTGKIYHAILLKEAPENEDEKATSRSEYGSDYSIHTPDDALYVYEIVEMELGLLFTDSDQRYNCAIHLHYDKGNKSRYFCSHNAGIHTVNLPMVSQLDDYVNASSGENANVDLPCLTNQSSSQYLICTRTKHTGVDEATPILGFGLLQEPCFLIALLYTGIVVDLSVIDLHYLPRIEPPEPIVNKSKKLTKESFDTCIKNMLKHEASQPVTKLGSRGMSPKECLELLYRATHIFRAEHFERHDKARVEIEKKVRALKALKTHLLKELDSMMETKKELQQTAEKLAERYEDIKDKQEELARRAEAVLRLVNYKEPSMTAIERAEAEELQKMDVKVRNLSVRLKQLRKKSKQQSIHLEDYECNEKKREIVLSNNQEEIIKNNLGQMAKEIQHLISQVKKIEEEI